MHKGARIIKSHIPGQLEETHKCQLHSVIAKYIPALLGVQSTAWGESHMLPSRGVRVWVVYLTPKIERVIVLLSASPEGEARLPMPKGMAYKE
jgi:hypothetical protein